MRVVNKKLVSNKPGLAKNLDPFMVKGAGMTFIKDKLWVTVDGVVEVDDLTYSPIQAYDKCGNLQQSIIGGGFDIGITENKGKGFVAHLKASSSRA